MFPLCHSLLPQFFACSSMGSLPQATALQELLQCGSPTDSSSSWKLSTCSGMRSSTGFREKLASLWSSPPALVTRIPSLLPSSRTMVFTGLSPTGVSPPFLALYHTDRQHFTFLKLILPEVLPPFADGGCIPWWVWSYVWHRAGLASPHKYCSPSLPTLGHLPEHSTLTSVKHLRTVNKIYIHHIVFTNFTYIYKKTPISHTETLTKWKFLHTCMYKVDLHSLSFHFIRTTKESPQLLHSGNVQSKFWPSPLPIS